MLVPKTDYFKKENNRGKKFFYVQLWDNNEEITECRREQ